MARRNNPYLPLYVQDFLSDEKLAYCSASATGVYIRLMCIMHKSEDYGKVLLKQKFKQSDKQIKNFASQLAIQMPYDFNTILCALEELIDSKVLSEEPGALIQKRMVRDNEISELRSSSGREGGRISSSKKPKKEKNFALNFAQAKVQANTENENENENENEYEFKDRDSIGGMGGKEGKEKGERKTTFEKPTVEDVTEYCLSRKNSVDAEKFVNFYESKGWMVGKNKMKDWKASVRTWEKSEQKTSPKPPLSDDDFINNLLNKTK